MKRSALFSLVLLTSFAAHAEEIIIQESVDALVETISEVTESSDTRCDGVLFTDAIKAFAQEIPGKVYVKVTSENSDVLAETFEFEHVLEFGYDATVTNDADYLNKARELGLDIIETDNNASVIVFNTDKHDDIINWLSL